jgi:nucleotide-binding universal stress UspA family protein
MKNILLPTDFSENSWNAIVYALNFLKEFKCNFYLLHVNRLSSLVTNDSGFVPTDEVVDEVFTLPAKKQLRQILKRIASEIPHNSNHKFYNLTDYNYFIESVRKQVLEKQIDTIVMGTKGASGLKKLIVGSNSGDVITKVQCTTLVVPENARFNKLEEMAFPTDFSLFYGLDTLEPISDILDHYDSFLRILYISKKKEALNTNQQANKELLEDYFGDHNHSFHFLTNKNIEDAVQCFTESRDIDMIAMVAKNLNYFQQILFHSKVEEISYHTDVPFLVLHE